MQPDLVTVGKQFYDNAEKLIDALVDVPQNPCSVTHRFGPGLYIREVRMPAGTFAIGHEQKFEHMNVFIKGAVRMLNADGSTTDMVAPMTFIGKPGRKCGLILEDVVWQNIYATDETDIDKLEEMFLNKPADWDAKMQVKALTAPPASSDYVALLKDLGMTEDAVQAEVTNGADLIPMPVGYEGCVVRKSAIHGKGLFVTIPIGENQIIAPMRIGGMRTPAGRYTNHSSHPNADVRRGHDDSLYLVALCDLNGCMGGSIGTEVTIDYRQALAMSKEIVSCQQ